MDSFTERMLERAKARQKKLEEYFSSNNEKSPLQEANVILQKYENASSLTQSEPNLVSDSSLNMKTNLYDSSMKENLSDSNISKKSCTRVSSDLSSSPQSPTKTLNIQKENFNMEIKLTSSDSVRVEVQIEERDEDSNEGNNENDDFIVYDKPKICVDKQDGVDDKPTIRHDVKNRLQRLGKLYSDADEIPLSSPITRNESKFCVENDDSPNEEVVKKSSGLGKLKALSNTINQWEDEVSAPNTNKVGGPPKKSWKPPAPKPPFVHSYNKGPAPQPPIEGEITSAKTSREASPEKRASSPLKNRLDAGDVANLVPWDNNVIASLESQGFTRTSSNSKLVYNYKKDDEKVKERVKLEDVNEEPEQSNVLKMAAKFIPKSPTKTNLRSGGDVINKVNMFEQSPSKSKDPALLSVSERKALFEKNKGAALVPKAAFGMAAPVKHTSSQAATSSQKLTNPSKSAAAETGNSKVETGGIASKMKALLEKKITISQSQIVNNIQEQRQKDLQALKTRYNKNKGVVDEIDEDQSSDEDVSETTKMIPDRTARIVQFKEKTSLLPPPPPPLPVPSQKSVAPKRRSKGDSPKVREVLEDVKRIRVSPPKSGRMYPCLSDIEASTETEQETTTAEPTPDTSYEYEDNCSFESDEPNTSFGREILEVVTKNQTPQKRQNLDDSTTSDVMNILDDMNEYLEEDDDYSDYTEGPTPPKHGRSTPPKSNSFHYSKGSPIVTNSPKKSTDLPTHVVEGEHVVPLTHTVSFYRKQQAQGSRTPVRQIIRQPVMEESPETETTDESTEVSEKIQDLMNTVTKQQTVISQASQALNLCCSTIEFSGSSEQVEAERLLLVATQRRQAALHEVQRLRVEGTLHPGGSTCIDKGSLTITDITLPLKKEYVRALSAAGGQGHHVVCLIRSAEHVIPTRLVSTIASPKDLPELNLKIPGTVKLDNIYSDFAVTVEVYSLQAQEELLPHEVKYHINTKKSGNKSTPKKQKNDSKLVMPTVQSPAGPQAVRTSSFALMGYIVFSLQAINRTNWTLNKAPSMSPLEGSVQMKVHCELAASVEHRGFLTMFEDISGFGAWHRRWCLLKGHNLNYWKYPDDERKKPPIDSINLQICTTKNIGPVSRDICARPHTFLLETIRPAISTDKDSLVTVCRGSKTMIRHLISADTKEERIEWCEKFNKALDALRLWGHSK